MHPYPRLELGGLGQFELTFTQISVVEVNAEDVPDSGDESNMLLWVSLVVTAGMSVCILLGKKRAIF